MCTWATVAAQGDLDFEQLVQGAALARQSNRLEEAAALYREAVRRRSDWGEGWWHLGNIAYERGRFSEAREAFQEVLRLEPAGGPAWGFLGLAEFQLSNYPASLEAFQKALTLGTGDNDQLTSLVRYHAGLMLNRAAHFQQARHLFLELIERSGEHPVLMEALGLTALAQPLLPAEAGARQRDLRVRLGRAVYFTERHRIEPARREFLELLRLYPGEANVHYSQGVFLQWEDPEAALAAFQKTLDLDPAHVSARLAIALEYLRRGDLPPARPYAEEAVRRSPETLEARTILGRILLEMGEIPGAVQQLEAAVQIAPQSEQARYLLARAYQKAGRTEAATRERETFLRLKQGSSP